MGTLVKSESQPPCAFCVVTLLIPSENLFKKKSFTENILLNSKSIILQLRITGKLNLRDLPYKVACIFREKVQIWQREVTYSGAPSRCREHTGPSCLTGAVVRVFPVSNRITYGCGSPPPTQNCGVSIVPTPTPRPGLEARLGNIK